jgi:hypothetical protein
LAGVMPAARSARKKPVLESPLMVFRIMSGFAFAMALMTGSTF